MLDRRKDVIDPSVSCYRWRQSESTISKRLHNIDVTCTDVSIYRLHCFLTDWRFNNYKKTPYHWPFVEGFHRRRVYSPDKGLVMRRALPCYSVIINTYILRYTIVCILLIIKHKNEISIMYRCQDPAASIPQLVRLSRHPKILFLAVPSSPLQISSISPRRSLILRTYRRTLEFFRPWFASSESGSSWLSWPTGRIAKTKPWWVDLLCKNAFTDQGPFSVICSE